MKRITLIFALLLLSTQLAIGQKYLTRNGHIRFFSHTPVEDIEAHNYQVTSVLDTESGNLVFAVLMKAFQFEKALMQEHFNEKYVESDQFPKAEFKGKIVNLDEVDFATDGIYPVTVKGEITLHGITQPLETEGTVTVRGDKIEAKAVFPIMIADHEIEVPGVVREKIAEAVETTVEMAYEPYGG